MTTARQNVNEIAEEIQGKTTPLHFGKEQLVAAIKLKHTQLAERRNFTRERNEILRLENIIHPPPPVQQAPVQQAPV